MGDFLWGSPTAQNNVGACDEGVNHSITSRPKGQGGLLRKPMYQLGLGHSTLIPHCELGFRVVGCGGKEGAEIWAKTLTLVQASTTIVPSFNLVRRLMTCVSSCLKGRSAVQQTFVCCPGRTVLRCLQLVSCNSSIHVLLKPRLCFDLCKELVAQGKTGVSPVICSGLRT